MIKNRAVLLSLSSTLVLVTKAANEAPLFTNSLRDCRKLADLFDYTYYDESPYAGDGIMAEDLPYPTSSQTKQFYEYVQCNYPGVCPDGNDAKISCSWQRFFYVSCTSETDGVYISVATNSLPNHCYFSQTSYPLGSQTSFQAYQFRSRFNIKPEDQMLDTQGARTRLEDQAAINLQLCNENAFSTISIDTSNKVTQNFAKLVPRVGFPSQTAFSKDDWILDTFDFPLLGLQKSDSVVGVALNGVFFFSATSQYGYDVFYPQEYGKLKDTVSVEVDHCLGSVDTFKTYRYHSFSPCIYNLLNQVEPQLCESITSCRTDIIKYALAPVPEKVKSINPIGIAKDGRVIYGPYKADGTLWQPCEVDVCNGVTFGGGSYYGYVATSFHPYLVGCWGPGNMAMDLKAQCSGNARLCTSAASYIQSFVTVFGALIALVFAF